MRRLASILLVVGLALVSLATSALAAVTPTFPGDDGRLLFSKQRRSEWTLNTMDPDGANRLRISSEATEYQDATYSPDGQLIAFWRFVGDASHVFVMNADGTDERQVTTGDTGFRIAPVWSPDGTKLVYQYMTDFETNSVLRVIDADGTDEVDITTTDEVAYMPAWSPDSSKIAYVRVDGDAATLARTDLWIVNADGTSPTAFTTTRWIELDPSWSSDGQTIYYQRMGLRSKSRIRSKTLTGTGTLLTDGTFNDEAPRLSPDGTTIAFRRCGRRTCGLWVMDTDGANQTRLMRRRVEGAPPTWSPSSESIAVTKLAPVDGRLRWDIFTVQVSDGSKDRLTQTRADEVVEAWQAL